jgi:sugar phosphate isomerase/epimerase
MQVSFAMMGFGWTQEVAERCIQVAGRLGYDGIDLWKQYLDTADLAWVRETCAAQGLQIVQICPYFDFTSSQASASESMREAETFIGYAQTLGASYIRTYTGITPSADADDAMWDRCVKSLREACDMAAASEVKLLLETHQVIHSGPCLTDTSPTTIRLLELVDRPNLTLAIQTPLVGETPEYTARKLGRYAAQIQAHNWIGATESTWGQLTFLDAGDLDFAEYLRILRGEGFDGWISVEHANHHPWKETAAHEIAYLQDLINPA